MTWEKRHKDEARRAYIAKLAKAGDVKPREVNTGVHMNKLAIAVSTAALLLGSVALSMAQTREPAPGQQMQEKGSVPNHPGASGYAPGHDRDDLGKGTLRDRDDRGTTMDRDRK